MSNILSPEQLISSVWARWVLPSLSVLLICLVQYLIFIVVPDENVMGSAQRIFYFHVGAAFTSYLMIAILFIASVYYLWSADARSDHFARAAAEIALLFASIVLITGMIWGKSSWNTYWRWEPRIVSQLILWLTLAGYVLVRKLLATEEVQAARFAAVLGVLATVLVPVVIFSIRLIEPSAQLHPQVISNQGLRAPSFVWTLLTATLALGTFASWLWLLLVAKLFLQAEITNLSRQRHLEE